VLRCADNVRDAASASNPVAAEEACDDNNVVSGDGCKNDCSKVEDGYECTYAGGPCQKICGNGVVDGVAHDGLSLKLRSTFSQGKYSAEQ